VQKILGLPTGDATGIIIIGGSPGASVAHFKGGTIYTSPATGAHILYGAINTEYTATATEKGDSGGMVQTILGLPTTDIVNVTGGSMISFQGGTIYSSPATGAHAVYGAIAIAYAASANETDFQGYPVQALLGLPTTELSKVGNQFVQHFQGGAFYVSPSTHVISTLYGPLEAEYEATVQEFDANGHVVQSLLGPLLGVVGAGTNNVVAIFQNGSIYWSPDTGAHVLYGAVATEYNATAQETDANGHNVQDILGLPTSDEAPLGVSYGLLGYSKAVPPPGARFVTFQGGNIFWSPNTGAHALIGAIAAEYATTLNEVDYFGTNILQTLGLPISDETLVPGGREVKFQGGAIYWSQDTGAHVVSGPIYTKYISMQGPASYLGLPTSDGQFTGDPTHPIGSDIVFQYGKIMWLPASKIGAYAIQETEHSSSPFAVNFSDGTPIGGSTQLTVYSDGTYTFTGKLHDSGFPSYDATITIGLVSTTGQVIDFTHVGHMAGTIESGSRDDSWSYTGTSAQLAAEWIGLLGGTVYMTQSASFDLDANTISDTIKSAAQDAVNAFERNETLAAILASGLACPVLGVAEAIIVHEDGGDSLLVPQ
jgi:uncharacterized protein with LGFP repeats